MFYTGKLHQITSSSTSTFPIIICCLLISHNQNIGSLFSIWAAAVSEIHISTFRTSALDNYQIPSIWISSKTLYLLGAITNPETAFCPFHSRGRRVHWLIPFHSMNIELWYSFVRLILKLLSRKVIASFSTFSPIHIASLNWSQMFSYFYHGIWLDGMKNGKSSGLNFCCPHAPI